MKKLVLTLAILGSMAAFADEFNVYTKVGASFIGNQKDLDSDFYHKSANAGANQKREALLVKGYGFNVEATKNLNDVVEVGAGIGYIINNQVSYTYTSTVPNNPTISVKALSTDQVPVYATTKINFNLGEAKPYVTASLGYSFNTKLNEFKYSESAQLPPTTNKVNEKDSHGGLYMAGGLGLEYNNVLVELSGKYAGYEIVVDADTNKKNKKFNGYFTAGINVGYKFSL